MSKKAKTRSVMYGTKSSGLYTPTTLTILIHKTEDYKQKIVSPRWTIQFAVSVTQFLNTHEFLLIYSYYIRVHHLHPLSIPVL